MSLIYLIGGATFSKMDSLNIDMDIIKETHKTNPNVLYIGAANLDKDKNYYQFKEYYEKIGAKVSRLLLFSKKLSKEELILYLNNLDVIYIGGGLTYRLYEIFIKNDIKWFLYEAIKRNIIICGMSAGANILCDFGHSDNDAYRYGDTNLNYSYQKGLGLIRGIFCPHYDSLGKTSFHELVKELDIDGYALEDGTALKISNDKFCLVKENHKNAFMLLKKDNHRLEYLVSNKNYEMKLGEY